MEIVLWIIGTLALIIIGAVVVQNGYSGKDEKDMCAAGMLSEIEEIETENDLDAWVQQNIIIYFNKPELQKAVRAKRYEIIHKLLNHGKSTGKTNRA